MVGKKRAPQKVRVTETWSDSGGSDDWRAGRSGVSAKIGRMFRKMMDRGTVLRRKLITCKQHPVSSISGLENELEV